MSSQTSINKQSALVGADKETVGSIIRGLMIKHGHMTESKLAREIQLPQPTINRLLSGETMDPRISTLNLIADFFKVSIDQLIGKAPLDISQDKDDQENLNCDSPLSSKIYMTHLDFACLTHFLDGKSSKKIAKLLNMPCGVIENKIHLLKKKLGYQTRVRLTEKLG